MGPEGDGSSMESLPILFCFPNKINNTKHNHPHHQRSHTTTQPDIIIALILFFLQRNNPNLFKYGMFPPFFPTALGDGRIGALIGELAG